MSLSPEAISAVKEFLTLDAKIEEYDTALKALKKRKAQLQASVFQYMRKNDIKKVNLPGGQSLQTTVRKSRPGITKKWVEERLTIYCTENRIDYNRIYDFIYDPQYRPQIEKTTLRKVKGKKPKPKK